MAAPVSVSAARSIARLAWTSSAIRPSLIASITTPYQLPTRQHQSEYRTSALTIQARARWAKRRNPPIRPNTTSPPKPISRPFTTTPHRPRDHHFDTLKFVQRLRAEGFTEPQASAMLKVLSDVIEESIQNLTRTMVLREDQEKATYTQKVDFAKLRSELLSADTSESTLTRASHERLTNDLVKLNNRLRDETQRTQASVRLDLNLEKGRIREEANSQELKIKETETRIEQESAALRERLEAVKFSTLQWLMGVCTGTAAIILGVWRLLM
ncbi:hypothetical protein LTR62_003797 [Meristemomyces frigidus]|uniref:DUF1640-domain-containing protein n=1 Tax=Meristemomyces frigidus TaxID=1508187 RepID=A0AAN7TJK8_9PEZI|nr:hypothetical protein LTR62_003797 [Meristemomyces frigidus]